MKFRFIEEYDKVYHSSEVQEELNRFKTYLDELRVRTGKNSSLTSSDVILLHNNLDIERRLNLTMEPWMVKELKDGKLSDLRKLYYKIWAHNDKLKRIAGGTLITRCSNVFFFGLINVYNLQDTCYADLTKTCLRRGTKRAATRTKYRCTVVTIKT